MLPAGRGPRRVAPVRGAGRRPPTTAGIAGPGCPKIWPRDAYQRENVKLSVLAARMVEQIVAPTTGDSATPPSPPTAL